MNGQETAAAVAAVRAIYPGAFGNPLYSVYPLPIHDRYEYRYFYDLEIELALCFRPAPALCTELEYLVTNKWNLT